MSGNVKTAGPARPTITIDADYYPLTVVLIGQNGKTMWIQDRLASQKSPEFPSLSIVERAAFLALLADAKTALEAVGP